MGSVEVTSLLYSTGLGGIELDVSVDTWGDDGSTV